MLQFLRWTQGARREREKMKYAVLAFAVAAFTLALLALALISEIGPHDVEEEYSGWEATIVGEGVEIPEDYGTLS